MRKGEGEGLWWRRGTEVSACSFCSNVRYDVMSVVAWGCGGKCLVSTLSGAEGRDKGTGGGDAMTNDKQAMTNDKFTGMPTHCCYASLDSSRSVIQQAISSGSVER